MKRSLLAVSLMWLVPGLAGCAPTDIKWTEEVKLHDGKTIQIKRRSELGSPNILAQTRGHPRYHELCYAPMGIYWKSKPEYEPEAFDIVNGKAYVRVPLRGCSSCMHHGYPETNTIYFAWDGKLWNKITEREMPGQVRFNLLNKSYVDDDGSRDARGFITLADKDERDGGLYYGMKRTGAKGLGEWPNVRNLCRECKGIEGTTTSTAEVFMPRNPKGCD